MKLTPDEEPFAAYAFCESVHAGSASRWHIRKLAAKGRKCGGGIDTNSLCGHVKAPMGWDLEVKITEKQLTGCCPQCVFAVQFATMKRSTG